MRMHSKIVRLLFCVSLCVHVARAEHVWRDFDSAMHTVTFSGVIESDATYNIIGIHGTELIHFFRQLYARNVSSLQYQQRVPKIIHQIWIGKGVPQEFRQFQKSWQQMHPDWEYRLWTYDDIAREDFCNKDLMYQSRNPGEISDLMRYEILYRYGGVYIDFDFECLRPLDKLNLIFDLYLGIQPLDSGYVQLGIGLIGAIAGHPLLKYAITAVRSSWVDSTKKSNPPAKTGPLFLTKIFYECAGKKSLRDVALPADYFYPLSCRSYDLKTALWRKSGSYGIHHWAGSWMKRSFRRQQFQQI